MGNLGGSGWLTGNCEIMPLMGAQFISAKEILEGAQTPLGAIATWAPNLKNVFSILSNAPCPMFVLWVVDPTQSNFDDRLLLYNDAYLTLLNDLQPQLLLNQSAIDQWQENWRDTQFDVEQVFTTGQPRQRETLLHSATEYPCLYVWSYSAIWDEVGFIRGVFATGSQTSEGSGAKLLEEGAIALAEREQVEPKQQQINGERDRLLPEMATERTRFKAVLRQMPQGGMIDGSSVPVVDDQGRITSAIVVFQDVADRKRVELALRQSEERAQLAIQVGRLGTWHYHLEQNLVELDERMREIWGEPKDTETIQLPKVIERIHPDDRERVSQAISAALNPASSGTYEIDYRIIWDDGTERWVSANGQVQFIGEGISRQPVSFLGTALDITERKQAEAVLRENENQLRLLTNALPVLISYIDQARRYQFVNQTYTDWFGLAPEEMIGQYVEDIVGATAYQVIRPDIDQALSGQKVNSEKYIFFNQLGWRHVQRYFVPDIQEDGEVKGFYALVNDVTEHRQAEAALHQNEEQLRLAQRAAGAGLWDWNMVTNQVTWSEEYYQLYGLENTVTPSYENWLATILERDRDHVAQAVQRTLEQQTNLNVEFRIFHSTQGIRWLTAIGQTFYDTDQQPIRMTGIALDITQRKQVEVEREELLVREQALREAAQTAEQRARFLVEASITLTSSLDFEYTLKSVAHAVVPTLADWCAVDIIKEDGTLERLATTHVDPAKLQWGLDLHRRYPPDLNSPRGVAKVLRTGRSEYYPRISDDLIVAAARDADHLQILREIGFSSVMLVPLNTRGKTLGVISFVSAESGRFYSPEDLTLAEELARRAAIALDNARLYQDAEQTRQAAERAVDRITRLQTVTAALSESLTPEQVAEVIVEQSMATIEATAALVVLVSPDRTELEIVNSVGYAPDLVESWRRFSINVDAPLAEAIRTKKPVWVETILERIARYPHLAEVYARYDFKSWIAIPLVVEDQSIGGVLLSFREFKDLDQDDREFILALSRQCAQAISRAKLYEAERSARAEAERANRVKDEFLAVLSHELRSPLNPILGWSKLLQTRKFDESATMRALETIERNAKLQTELIDDLLDVSRILRGKMILNTSEINLAVVIEAALETVQLSAEAKNITIEKIVEGTISSVLGDSARLQQVIWNLLSNAIKFTPPGGQVTIRLEQIEMPSTSLPSDPFSAPARFAQIQITDTGKGITPKFLPHVFEYFRQEDGTTTRKFGGLGLGLAIVRYLTELHGGTVKAESPGEGLGATFTVLLPIASHRREKLDEAETADLEADALPLANVRILVVDDEADMRVLTSAILEQTGAETMVVTSAVEALEVWEEFQPDVLISDIGMPEIDGYELLRRVKNLPLEGANSIPALALTAYAGETDQQQAQTVGFQQHLAKPVDPEDLVSAIVSVLKSRLQESSPNSETCF